MSPVSLLWLIGGFVACSVLIRLMSARQAELTASLRAYVEQQLEWAKKRAHAAKLAQQVAEKKEADERHRANLANQVAQSLAGAPIHPQPPPEPAASTEASTSDAA